MMNICRGGPPWPPVLACIRRNGWPRRATPTVFVLILCITACSSQNVSNSNRTGSSETIVSSTPPFQTREPDRYRATRTITIVNAGGETVVTKNLIARDGDMRRNESETASKRIAYLDLPEGRFVLLVDDKVYADLTSDVPTNESEEITPEHFLHTETGTTGYQKMGTEVVSGRNSNKYRIVVNSSNAGNVSSNETLVWIDEALNMPIRSETKSSDGTRITTELNDVVLDVDKRIFQVPEDYQKVAFSEFRKRLTK